MEWCYMLYFSALSGNKCNIAIKVYFSNRMITDILQALYLLSRDLRK